MNHRLFYGILPLLGLTFIPTTLWAQPDLLYLSSRDKNFDIFRYDFDGGQEYRLTTNPGWDWNPQWSKAKQGILYYQKDSSGQFSIQLMDTRGQKLPFDPGKLPDYHLSPDGTRVVYTKSEEGAPQQICLKELATGKDIWCSPKDHYHGRPKWHPDGAGFSLISDQDGDPELFFYDIEQKKLKQLTHNHARVKYHTWSPEGKFLAFTLQYYEEGKADQNEMYLFNLQSGRQIRLSDRRFNDTELAWSPDGQWIAFHSDRAGGDHIFMMELSSQKIFQVTTLDSYHGEPAWVGTE